MLVFSADGYYSNWPGVQWLFLGPVKGGRWHIIPQLAVYTTYILPSGGLYATYHLLREPETTIESFPILVMPCQHLAKVHDAPRPLRRFAQNFESPRLAWQSTEPGFSDGATELPGTPKLTVLPLKIRPSQKERIVSQPPIFRLVSGRKV